MPQTEQLIGRAEIALSRLFTQQETIEIINDVSLVYGTGDPDSSQRGAGRRGLIDIEISDIVNPLADMLPKATLGSAQEALKNKAKHVLRGEYRRLSKADNTTESSTGTNGHKPKRGFGAIFGK